jgi:hypothetical protein
MNFTKMLDKSKVKAAIAEKPSHLNIPVLVSVDANGDILIRLPKAHTEHHVYESGTIDPKTGKPKKTTMAYCIAVSADPKARNVIVPMTVTGMVKVDAEGNPVDINDAGEPIDPALVVGEVEVSATANYRIGGFNIFQQSAASD